MYYVKVYGESTNYYLAKPNGSATLSMTEAWGFETEEEARETAGSLYSRGLIGHWEIRDFLPIKYGVN